MLICLDQTVTTNRSALGNNTLAPQRTPPADPGTVLALMPPERLLAIVKGLLVMVLYKRKFRYSIGKWILAALIFILAMTVTFANVEGCPFF